MIDNAGVCGKLTPVLMDTATQPAAKFDVVAFIMAWEASECSDTEVIDGFADLIKTGTAWQLQGAYGRQAAALIQHGFISRTGEVLKYPDGD